MDPGGSELDSSLPQPENPCLIVEDSQPDSVALEDDPESSYRALLARRLSDLQPAARSPVLELISSPLGSRCSQTDSQSESSQSNSQAEPVGVLTATNTSSAFQEESQVINLCPPPVKKKKSAPEDADMDSGADSTTHCCSATDEGTSQFGFLELSQSQDLRGGEAANSQQGETAAQPDSERRSKTAVGVLKSRLISTCSSSPSDQNTSSRTSASQENKSLRSEVSSSSSSDSPAPSGRTLSVQALLHSQGLQASGEQEQQDGEVPSSQDDLFDTDKTGAAVDSTVSEPEQQQQRQPTATPSCTLRLLHLSGQGTLAQDSLSQSSVDYVAPTPDNFSHTPLIVPSSPTGPENEHGADEPMDTSLPPDDGAGEKEEQPMEMEAASKPHPSASTPVSQNPPGFALERTFSLPSQPEFSHDVFVPTQSQETLRQSDKKSSLSTASQQPESAPLLTSPLQLSVNTEQIDEDSQATQIEEVEETPGVDAGDSVTSCRGDAVVSQSRVDTSSKASAESQKSDVHEKAATSLNVVNVNVTEVKSDTSSCSQPKLGSPGPTVNSCVQETPLDATPGSPPSQSVISQTSVVDVARSSEDVKGGGTTASQQCGAVGNSQTDNVMTQEEVVVMEEEEEEASAGGGGASGIDLVLSQSELLSPEPMEEEEEDGEEPAADSVIVVTDSERDSQILKKDVTPPAKSNSSQPIRGDVAASTNGHESQAEKTKKKVNAAPDGMEAEGLKDKSLSDSSGEISFHFTLPKEGELIGPAPGTTPPLINQLKQRLRHSTPIEISPFSEKSDLVADVSADVAMAAGDNIVSGDGACEDGTEQGDGKLSLRMKLVTPVGEGSSETFSLQKPALSEEDGSVVKVTTVSKAVTSPSVFSRVHRQREAEGDSQPAGNASPVRISKWVRECHAPSPEKWRLSDCRRGYPRGSNCDITVGGKCEPAAQGFRPMGLASSETHTEKGIFFQICPHSVCVCVCVCVCARDLLLDPEAALSRYFLHHVLILSGRVKKQRRDVVSFSLTEIGPHSVCVCVCVCVCAGVVRGHKTEGQDLFYSVERDGQQQWYNRTSVILSLEQGNRLREQHSLGPYEPAAPLAKASDISLDNLVEGKRRRRVTLGGPDTPNRSSSSSPRTPGPSGKRKLRTTSEDDRTPAKRGRRGPGARAVQRVGACNTSGSGTDLPGPSGDAADTHGPLPQNASLFLGFAFMLTASSESDRLTNLLTAGDDDDDYVQTSPYNKAYTESQLQAGGGFVLPDFNEEQCKAAYQSLLIADQHCRTRKYLQCLASGVPCVSHVWVRDCCKENKLLNYRNYLLPAGVGPDAAVVEWHPRCSPFKALRVLLVFEEPVELWAQLVTMGGASSVRQFQGDKDGSDIPTGKYDVVVTDRACPPLVEKSVTSQDVPLVSPEWIIESVIGGERLGFRSKPQYRHDYAS
ncbi:putative tumor suppressor p53-binding protein 1 [Scophthalmus maximus]|uniref:Putative tumor suppressor p53-binding protein 1 n=1 Tax=Scophthalmus maximus TaxID=52904 RepID=A0A2U9BBI2_SCOMX|nr:putative tumor suppressor p53-binding protein 1 [Scophthalmus maximus]